MHAWSEVDHDLTYKPTTGILSEDELAILDQINGLVIAGEIALERLQKSSERRLGRENAPIGNHFELAALLHKRFAADDREPNFGRVDILWNILKRAELDNKGAIDPFLTDLDPQPEAEPISDQIAARILSNRPDLYKEYVRLQSGAGPQIYEVAEAAEIADVRDHIGSFLANWIVLERTASMLSPSPDKKFATRMSVIASVLGEVGVSSQDIGRLRTIRNHLVHGVEIPGAEALLEENNRLEAILTSLSEHQREDVRQAYQNAAAPLNILGG
jgi:hypothetical protein